MPRQKLTSIAVDKLKNSKGRRQEFFDTLMPGLALRVSKRDCKSWVLFHRPQGKLVRTTLGRYPVLTLAEAREQARGILQQQYALPHIRPTATVLTPVSTEPQRRFADTFAEFIERYAKVNTRSWRETERLIQKRVFPFWENKNIAELRKADMVSLLDGIIDDGAPVQANLTFAHVRKFYNWCRDRGYIEKSPCDGMGLPTRVESRDRVLTDEELKTIWRACGEMAPPFGDLIKVLLLTGQRRGEVAGMLWAEIEGDIWTLPKARTKNGSIHHVPLAPLVKELIERQGHNFSLVFTTTGETPVSGFSKAKGDLDKLSGVSNWRIHDLRRTCATGLARLKVSPHVVEKILNHKSGTIKGVAAVYNRHGYADECRDALRLWTDFIGDLTDIS